MSAAETVEHLGRSMQWDFRVLAVLNLVLWAVLLLILLRGRR